MRTQKLNLKVGKHSKMYKDLKKGLDEAIKDVKEDKAPAYSPDGRKNYHFCGNKGWPTIEEMLADWDKEEKERWKKMTPEQRKKEKAREKEKAQREKIKEQKRQEKYAKQRAKKGYCDVDTWSYDYWFLEKSIAILTELVEIKHGWQPYLGWKIVNKKLVRTKKGEEITFKQEKEVINYLIANMKKLYEYLNMDDLDSKKKYNKKFYIERDRKMVAVKKETFTLLGDILFSLWD